MFERFTAEARACVTAARNHATQEQAHAVDERHLLTALLDLPRVRDMTGFDANTAAQVVTTLRASAAHGGLRREELDALASAGIDAAAVAARLRAWHHSDTGGRRRRRRPWGGVGFSAGAKAALEQALRQGIARHDRMLRSEHLLLGLLVRPGPVADVLAEQGVTVASVHTRLDARPAA